jgi:hypothetical protein
MKLSIATLLALCSVTTMAAGVSTSPVNPYLQDSPYVQAPPVFAIPSWMPFAETAPGLTPPWTMSKVLSKEQKSRMVKMMMPWLSQGMHMNMRDVMNFMTTKYKAKPGLSFDDVVESLKIRANARNFKLVGQSPMWKDIKAVLGDSTSPRMEVFHAWRFSTSAILQRVGNS